jgi:hypothetical protein
MKRSPPGKIQIHGQGTGDLDERDVEKRAREIATIRGHSTENITEEDRAEAWAELHGDHARDTMATDHVSRGSISRDPSEPLGDPGHQVADRVEEDESTAVERLANEGLEEAQHDQMLAARSDERRRRRQ